MTQTQIISEINKIVTQLPENKLEDLLLYLKDLEKSDEKTTPNDIILNKIFEEDNNVLKELAK
ncbi:hypothetical protein KRX57_02270 [Weeksellaceae bacterium TAE3-ERU29]|nr:hypothetical protein [Weeksellaceae bacterium TAE3-ERU29]